MRKRQLYAVLGSLYASALIATNDDLIFSSLLTGHSAFQTPLSYLRYDRLTV